MKDLIIVESPHKTIAISEFLGKDNYIVSASKGHVRDLKIAGSEGLGVNIDETKNPYEFSPVYEISSSNSLSSAVANISSFSFIALSIELILESSR